MITGSKVILRWSGMGSSDHQVELHWRLPFSAAKQSFDTNIAMIGDIMINAKLSSLSRGKTP